MLTRVNYRNSAQQGGWPCVILSDSLTVRSYSDPQAWAIPEPKVDSAPVPVTPTASASTNGIAAAPIVLERAEGLVRDFDYLFCHYTQQLIFWITCRRIHNNR